MATKFLLRYFSEIWLGNGFKPRGLFLSTQNLLFSIKQSFNSANNVQDLLDLIPVVDLVVWDDVAVSGLSAFEQNTLYDFINSRMNMGLANIFTSNVSDKDLEKQVGKRLSSRILSGDIVALRGKDRRRG